MRKKHIWLPAALVVYSCAVGCYSWRRHGGPTEGFWTTAAIELVVIVALFFLLRARDKRRE